MKTQRCGRHEFLSNLEIPKKPKGKNAVAAPAPEVRGGLAPGSRRFRRRVGTDCLDGIRMWGRQPLFTFPAARAAVHSGPISR